MVHIDKCIHTGHEILLWGSQRTCTPYIITDHDDMWHDGWADHWPGASINSKLSESWNTDPWTKWMSHTTTKDFKCEPVRWCSSRLTDEQTPTGIWGHDHRTRTDEHVATSTWPWDAHATYEIHDHRWHTTTHDHEETCDEGDSSSTTNNEHEPWRCTIHWTTINDHDLVMAEWPYKQKGLLKWRNRYLSNDGT